MNENIDDKSTKLTRQNSILYRLCGRCTLFTALTIFALIILYIRGGFQEFTDSTMDLILKLCSFACIMLTLISTFGLIDSIIMFVLTKKPNIWIFFTIYFLLMILSPIGVVLFRSITFLSQGIA